MEDFWAGCEHWSEEREQAFQDRWALRVLTCPRAACRRAKGCTLMGSGKRTCLQLIADPFTKEEDAVLRYRVLFALKKIAAERSDGTFKTKRAAREVARKRSMALAFERAQAELKARAGKR